MKKKKKKKEVKEEVCEEESEGRPACFALMLHHSVLLYPSFAFSQKIKLLFKIKFGMHCLLTWSWYAVY